MTIHNLYNVNKSDSFVDPSKSNNSNNQGAKIQVNKKNIDENEMYSKSAEKDSYF